MGDYNLIKKGMTFFGLEFDPDVIRQISLYLNEISKWNKHYRLVKAEGDNLVVKHLLDSLSAIEILNKTMKKTTILDVGSGAGFPGIPLALFVKESSFYLLERSAKKAAFLNGVVLLLNLKNVRILNIDLKHVQSRYDVITLRAFSPLQEIASFLWEIKNRGGIILSYKGRLSVLVKELTAIHCIVPHIEIKKTIVPFLNAERHLLILRD